MKLRIVLVRPRNPLNIGAAARAMANFGFDDLVVVDPYEPVWRETVSAVGAEALVLKARAVKTLEEAVEDCHLVIGTTAVKARQIDRPIISLPDIAAYLNKFKARGMKAALLFGSEKTGLGNPILETCNACLTIPTSPAVPSMNLSHSVALCCYELSRKGTFFLISKEKSTEPGRVRTLLATIADRERLIRHIGELFDATGYLGLIPEAQRTRKIRQALLQWDLRSTEVGLIHGVIRSLMNKIDKGVRQ